MPVVVLVTIIEVISINGLARMKMLYSGGNVRQVNNGISGVSVSSDFTQ